MSEPCSKLLELGVNVNDYLKAACGVTGEWVHDAAPDGRAPEAARDVRARLRPRLQTQRRIPLKLRTLRETLEPQPLMDASRPLTSGTALRAEQHAYKRWA